ITASSRLSTLSLHDALPISVDFDQVPAERQMRLRGLDVWLPPLVYDRVSVIVEQEDVIAVVQEFKALVLGPGEPDVLLESVGGLDRKSTRLNSSHVKISYAV